MPPAAPISKRPLEILVSPTGRGDYATLQGALAVATAGSTILLASGTYTLPDAGVFITQAGLTIRSISPRGAILRAPLTNPTTNISITAANVTLDGLEIDGRGSSQSTQNGCSIVSVQGTSPAPVDSVTIRDCYLHDAGRLGNGINGEWVTRLRILHCRIENHATSGTVWGGLGSLKGIYFTRADRCIVEDCDLTGWSQGIGMWTGTTNTWITRCRLVGNYGFEDDAGTTKRSAIEDYSNGVAVHGKNKVTHTVIDGATSFCLEIAQGVIGSQYTGNFMRNPGKLSGVGGFFAVVGGGTALGDLTSDILVADNFFESDGAKADYGDVNNAYRVTIRGNFFSGCNHNDVAAACLIQGTPPQGVSITGNHFHECRTGIRLLAAGDGCIISHNRFTGGGYTSNCILIDIGGKHLVEGNDISITATTAQLGILIQSTAGEGIRIIGNRISVKTCPVTNAAAAAIIQGNFLEELQATGSAGCFVLTGTGASKCVVRDNHCRSASKGAYVSSGALNNRVTDNFFLGAGNDVDTTGAGAGNTVTPNY